MEMPAQDASTEALLEDGDFHLAKLRGDTRATTVAAEFEPRQVALRLAGDGTQGASAALAAAESQAFTAESEVESVISRLSASVFSAVKRNASREPFVSIFPQHTDGALAPRGRGQVIEARRVIAVVGQLSAGSAASLPPETATVVAQLAEATSVLDTKSTALESAQRSFEAAWASELAERRRFRDQYRKDFGLLTAIYPDDRKKVEAFFRSRPKKKGAKKPGTPTPSPAPA